MMVYYYV